MNTPLESAIVRIRTQNGRVVGAGFLVFDKHVITCAHVIEEIIGTISATTEISLVDVRLDFPLVAPDQILTARVVFWKPARFDGSNDIAGLELRDSPPINTHPVGLLLAREDLWGHPFRTFGFPRKRDNGVWASGVLRAPQATGWIQIEDVKNVGYSIQPGFSGAPVWDEHFRAVVGMIVAADNRPETKSAFMIPTHLLIDTWAEITDAAYNSGNLKDSYTSGMHREDWGEAINVVELYGREKELTELEHWILRDRCRAIAILGMGGMGKTALAVRLAQRVKDQFKYLFWRDLKNAPPIKVVLGFCIKFLSGQTQISIPSTVDELISMLMHYLRENRCLLVLDNAESILQGGDRAGNYREGYEDYGDLIRLVSGTDHNSCLILTSREKPKEISFFESNRSLARTWQLGGLQESSAREFLRDKNLTGSEEDWAVLINRYAGNPLALKQVATTILEWFDCDISEFLPQDIVIFGDIRDLLTQQIGRLSKLGAEIMYWLAVEREPASMSDLGKEIIYSLSFEREAVSLRRPHENIPHPASRQQLLESIESLYRQSLIEKVGSRFTLQPVVMEYVTEQLIKNAYTAVTSESPIFLHNQALMKAQSKEYVRNSQLRLIVTPILDKLVAALGKEESEKALLRLLARLKERSSRPAGYAGGNILNMLSQIGSDLGGRDFSNLNIWQAYLSSTELQNTSFVNADLSKSVFAETFGVVLSLAFSPDGQFLVAGLNNGEIRVWEVAKSRQFLTWQGHTDWVRSVSFSSDSKMIASCSEDVSLNLWDANTGQLLKTLRGLTGFGGLPSALMEVFWPAVVKTRLSDCGILKLVNAFMFFKHIQSLYGLLLSARMAKYLLVAVTISQCGYGMSVVGSARKSFGIILVWSDLLLLVRMAICLLAVAMIITYAFGTPIQDNV